MTNTIQFALFFKEGIVYNPTKISSKIIDKLPNVGNPIILPIDTNAPKEANIPIIVFNQNVNFQATLNFNNIIISLKDKYINDLINIINSFFDIFNSDNISFVRMGYVPTIILDKNKLTVFKNEYLESDVFSDVDDFQFSWLKKLSLRDINVNCWERNFTDSNNNDGLIKMFDFNTNATEVLDINKKIIKEFIEFCNKYVDSRK